MNSGRFTAGQAGPEWHRPRDLTLLAKLCEGAGLTGTQAEVVRLATSRYTYSQIAAALSLSWEEALLIARRAERRLKQNQSWVHGALLEDLNETLICLRNTFNPKPRAACFRKIAGGYDTDPVRFRSRCFGEKPEDLAFEKGRLLRSVLRLLERRSVSRSA